MILFQSAITRDNLVKTDLMGRQWTNPDNIHSGELGYLFFLLELYRHTRDEALLDTIRRKTNSVIANSQGSFTLMYGKFGLAFFLLDLFEVTAESSFLDIASGIAFEHSTTSALYVSLLNNNSLFDGSSGILIFYIRLYHATKAPWVIGVIEKFARKITKDLMVCEEGYYTYEPNPQRRSNSFSHGNLGCCLGLLSLYALNNNFVFLDLAKGVLDFEQRYASENRAQGLSLGGVETLDGHIRSQELNLVAQYYQYASKNERIDLFEEFHLDVDRLLAETPGAIESKIAYLVLILSELSKMAATEKLTVAINKLSDFLMQRIDQVNDQTFFRGRPGIIYALLKSIDCKHVGTIIHFSINLRQQTAIGATQNPASAFLLSEFNQTLLLKDFPQSFPLMLRVGGGEFQNFLKSRQSDITKKYVAYVNGIANQTNAELGRILERELFAFNMKSTDEYWTLSDEPGQAVQIKDILSLRNEDIIMLPFNISKKARILNQELSFPVDYKMTVDQFMQYGSRSFVFLSDQQGRVEWVALGAFKIIMDGFNERKPTLEVKKDMEGFFLNQDAEIKQVLIDFYNLDQHYFKESLSTLFAHGLRHCLIEGWISIAAAP